MKRKFDSPSRILERRWSVWWLGGDRRMGPLLLVYDCSSSVVSLVPASARPRVSAGRAISPLPRADVPSLRAPKPADARRNWLLDGGSFPFVRALFSGSFTRPSFFSRVPLDFSSSSTQSASAWELNSGQRLN